MPSRSQHHRVTMVAVCLLMLLAGRAAAEPVACSRAVLKESLKFAEKAMKEFGKCEDRVTAGKLPPATDCSADAAVLLKVGKAESKLRAAMDRKCGGDDRTCGSGGDDDSLASIGWPAACPDFESLGCTNAIADCDGIGECLVCVNAAAVAQAVDLTFGGLVPTDPQTEKTLNKCQRTLGKETVKLHKAGVGTLRKCWDQRHKGKHANACPNPGDGKSAAKIASAQSKHAKKICKQCGGADGVCGGADDFAPAAVGFPELCPNVADCARVIAGMQDVAPCLACVTAFKTECEAAIAVPGLEPYPTGCAVAPPPPVCGNGTIEGVEECDDGDTADGDGCSAVCALEDTTAVCAGAPTTAGTAIASIRIASGLAAPVHITAAPLDPSRLFVVEQPGRIRVIKYGTLLPTPFLAIEGKVSTGSEQGLLSVAFHPDYESNGFFFVNYTDTGGDTVVARYQVSGNPDVADAGSETILLTVDQPFSNHNGGLNMFGPDGYLYVGMGDGGAGSDVLEAAQDDGTVLGKMLRLDVDVAVPPYWAPPPDNPDPNEPAPLGLIWAKGLRNPWRYSFDRATGEMYIADVGQNVLEEINIQPPATGGENYGWDVFEGRTCFEPEPLCSACPNPICPGSPTFNVPVLEYSHAQGCSITGGFVYRGCRLPDLHGTYFYSDFCSAFIRSFAGTSGGDAQSLADHTAALDPPGSPTIDAVTSFGEDARGELYIADQGGEIFKIVPAP